MTTLTAPHVLIVEDDFIIAADLAGHVERLGYTVAGSCATGVEAVAEVRKQVPALVLMDINLAGGMDGIATATAIRQFCQVPVIFLSGNSDPNLLARTQLTGVVGMINKPFTDEDLRNQIALAIGAAALPATAAQAASSESTIS